MGCCESKKQNKCTICGIIDNNHADICGRHCCECKIFFNNKHCCDCKINIDAKYHCCDCKINYNHSHCCICKMNYSKEKHCLSKRMVC